MTFRRIAALVAAALLVPMLAACTTSGDAADSSAPGEVIGAQPEGGARLAGSSWVLTAGPFTTGDLSAITLAFDESELFGTSGVNTYGGDYTSTEDGSLQIGPLRSTLMAGEPEAMTLEQEYLAALQSVFGYTAAGGTLTLFGAADQVLTFEADRR
jgi:heat shock protein HslJ